jgi:F-type H+-transporting ATPase subunit c
MRVLTFVGALLALALAPEMALAAEESAAAAGGGIAIGAGLAIGLAVLGAAIAQGLTVANSVQGIARNPGAAGQVQTPMIIGLAFIESLALFAFVIAFLVQGNL